MHVRQHHLFELLHLLYGCLLVAAVQHPTEYATNSLPDPANTESVVHVCGRGCHRGAGYGWPE